MSTGNGVIAGGRLTDLLRRVTTFGVTLARLDLRQEAQRHTAAVDWIAQAAGLGRYAALSEPERQRFLEQHLTAGDVRLDDLPRTASDDQVREVLDTFRVAARIHPESLGAYVITMASAPSDVLAVEFLQAAAGTSAPAACRAALRDAARSASMPAPSCAICLRSRGTGTGSAVIRK